MGEQGPVLMQPGTTARIESAATSRRLAGGPLMNVERMYVNDRTDVDLALQQAEFRQRAGAFS